MKKRYLFLGLIIVVDIILSAVILYRMYAPIPLTSTVEITCLITDENDCLKLPIITGTNLNGEIQTFPDYFHHSYQLIIMTFNREQQTKVLDFVPLFHELSTSRPDLGYYSLAMLGDIAEPIRPLISGGITVQPQDYVPVGVRVNCPSHACRNSSGVR